MKLGLIERYGSADVQRRAAGDGGAPGLGPQHLHVVPLPVRAAVPRVHGLRAGRRPVAGRARVPRRRRRAALRQGVPAHCECPATERCILAPYI